MKLLLKICLVIYVISCENLFSQEEDTLELKPKFGIFTNFNMNIQYANFSNVDLIPSCCQDNMFGTGSGFNFGLLADYWYTEIYGAQLRFGFERISNLMLQEESFKAMKYDKDLDDFVAVDGKFEYNLNSYLNRLYLNPLFAYHVLDYLDLFGGLDLGLIFPSSFNYIEKIKEPIGGYFPGTNNSPTRNNLDSTTDATVNFGLSLGASYQLQMNKDSSLFLCPEFFYTFILSSVVADAGWNVHSFKLGLAVKYMEPPPPPPPPEPPLDPPLPKYPGLEKPAAIFVEVNAVQIDSVSSEDKVVDIKVEDFVSHTMSPMLNYIFFEENSSEILNRYVKLTKARRDTFHLEKLRKLGVLETYYQILNIMGLRLWLDKTSKVTLVGTNSYTGVEKGNIQLSKDMANAVKKYFVDVWDIEPDRIEVKARHLPDEPSSVSEMEGQEENRRVEIISDDWKITEPVIVVDTTRNINRTTIKFYPKVKAETGLKSWKLLVKKKNNIIKEFSGKKTIPESISWELSSDSPEAQMIGDNITYSLIIEDGIGQFASTSEKKLNVEQMTIERKRIEKKLDREYEYYSLIIFEYGKYKLRGEHKKVIDIIKERLKPNSKVIITGHTDIMGNEKLNKRIATQRAMAVAKHLDIPDTQIIGIGQENLLYDNTLPEGRFYCRTVRITIETPIDHK